MNHSTYAMDISKQGRCFMEHSFVVSSPIQQIVSVKMYGNFMSLYEAVNYSKFLN